MPALSSIALVAVVLALLLGAALAMHLRRAPVERIVHKRFG